MSTNPELCSRTVTRLLHLPVTSNAEAFLATANATRRMVVSLDRPQASDRSRLCRFVVRGINAELELRGASPAGKVAVSADEVDTLEARVADAVYRARLIGAAGLAVSFDDLSALADPGRELGLEDSRTLARLIDLAHRYPLQIYFPEATAMLGVLGASRPLEEWLSAAGREGRAASIEYEREPQASHPSLDSLPDGHEPSPGSSEPERRLQAPDLGAFVTCAQAPVGRGATDAANASADHPEPLADADPAASAGAEQSAPVEPEVPPVELSDPERLQRCASWAAQLSRMSGPKVHSTIERAFVTAYVPLRRAKRRESHSRGRRALHRAMRLPSRRWRSGPVDPRWCATCSISRVAGSVVTERSGVRSCWWMDCASISGNS